MQDELMGVSEVPQKVEAFPKLENEIQIRDFLGDEAVDYLKKSGFEFFEGFAASERRTHFLSESDDSKLERSLESQAIALYDKWAVFFDLQESHFPLQTGKNRRTEKTVHINFALKDDWEKAVLLSEGGGLSGAEMFRSQSEVMTSGAVSFARVMKKSFDLYNPNTKFVLISGDERRRKKYERWLGHKSNVTIS